jgi:hypothetical protein
MQPDQDNLSPLRREEDTDAPEPMDFDLAMPLYHLLTPVTLHPESDFDNTLIGHHSASRFSSLLSNDAPKFNNVRSDQGSRLPIASTMYYPVMNGK